MKKEKRLRTAILIGFVMITGVFYTVFYMKPWKKETSYLERTQTENIELAADEDCAIEAEETKQSNDSANESKTTDERQNVENSEETIYVYLCGAVVNPDVYEVRQEERLMQVVEAAGGLTEDAAKEVVNLAMMVQDGKKYYIPTIDEVEAADSNTWTEEMLVCDDTIESVDSTDKNALKNAGNELVNINTAKREALMTLPGVGQAKADSILEYRNTVGTFETKEDIMKVSGIKEGLFHKISNYITVD